MTKKTQTRPKPKIKLNTAQINQKAQKLSDGHSKCELPVIPIYPVRYGLSIDYLTKARNGKISDLPATEPAGIGKSPNQELMQLRQGFVYIYAHTKHRLFSTDDKGKWLVFRYVTHSDDINSASEFEQLSDYQNAGLNASFLLCKWGEKGANGNWTLGKINTSKYPCMTNTISFNTAFVDKDVDIVDIAYSEYMWSSEIIERFEKDDTLRQIVMTTVNVSAPEKHSAPLKDLNIHVLEYQSLNKSNDLSEQTQSWYTKLKNTAIPSALSGFPDYKETGLMVALQDVVGEMHELQKLIIDFTEKQKAYYARYAYPITIGNIIDPKIGYDIKGKDYPFKEQERVIEQKGVRDGLVSEFNSKMTALLKEPFERYEKPAGELVKQVIQLAQRASFKEFFNISDGIIGYAPLENGIDRGFYVFYRLLSDLTYGLECTSNGVELLENLFSDDAVPANNSPTTIGWLKEHSKKVTDAVYGMAMKILPPQQRHHILKGYFRGMEHVYLNSGRTVANLAALRKIQFDKVMAIYGWDEKKLIKNVDYFFAEVADKQIDRLMKEERSRQYNHRRVNGGKKAIKKELRQIKQDLINYRRITLDEIRDLEARIQLSERYYGFSGVLAIYAGILSLNNDLTIPRKLARTTAGRLALDPVVVKTTAILDISVGTADMAYALKLIGKPGAGMGVLRNIAGASTRSILVGLRALAYTGAAVVGGLLTSLIAFGGLREAIANEDKVSIVANSAIMLSGVMLGLSVIKFSILPTLGPIGWVILLVATASIFLWGSTPLETWVKKGFWGKKRYFYWNDAIRQNVDTQIKRAEILANEEIAEIAQQRIARLELITTGQEDISSAELSMNDQLEDYMLISKGFEKELYEYDIQAGLKISKISQGYYRISCAEFRRTEPTTHNLVINLYEWGSAQALPIKRFYAGATGEVRFHLAENNIHIKEVRIVAEFTDKEGGTFEDVYFSEEFQNKTKEIQQQALAAMETAIDEGYSE
ncbi:toxin VasX [Rodentibacter caecimuris]|uniref:Toxin VasX N-terminal region domain-containing protein n=1 Tax=Rodentibacter caecimuris TaxID=1796644 RepID=A0ABX3L072_9PAST|nr:hypothetical protein BKG89_00825 [Rodentibacter heylii]